MATIIRVGGGAGGGNSIIATVPSGAVVTASKGSKIVTATSVDGVAILKIPEVGLWTVGATLEGETANQIIVEIYDEYPAELNFGLQISSLAVGSLIKINEGGTAVNYRVIHQGLPDNTLYDSSCDGTWVVREEIKTKMAFSDSTAIGNDYEKSNHHAYLSGEFLSLFDSKTQAVIRQVKIPYTKGKGSAGTLCTGADGLSTKFFSLSYVEITGSGSSTSSMPTNREGVQLSYFSSGSATLRKAYYEGTATGWLTRTPEIDDAKSLQAVTSTGSMGGVQYSASYGIRPAAVLIGTKVVDPTPNADGSYTLKV